MKLRYLKLKCHIHSVRITTYSYWVTPTERVNPTPYEWVLPGMLDKDKELEMVETLKAKLPRVVIYVDIAIDGKEERRLKNYAPYLYAFLVDHYSFQEMIGLFQILLPKH